MMAELESAVTPKNNSSTRAIKLLKLFIKQDKIVGYRYQYFYLEKNRVWKHNDNEGNYHIFRMMLEGMSIEDKQKYFIDQTSNNYSIYVNTTKCETTYNFVKHYNSFRDQLNKLAAPAALIDGFFFMMSLILNLANLEFIGPDSPGM